MHRGSLLVVSLLLHLHLVRVLHVSLRRLLLRLLLGCHRDEIERLLLLHAKVAHLLSYLRRRRVVLGSLMMLWLLGSRLLHLLLLWSVLLLLVLLVILQILW